jgi:hypothetical protein
MVKVNIPEEYMELVSIIKRLNNLQLLQDSCQSQQDIFYLHLCGWEDSLLWVLVKAMGYRPEELNLSTPQLEATRPFGTFLYSIFRLAEKVINVLDEAAKVWEIKERFSGYRNAHEWFWYLCLEQELGEIFTVLFPNESNILYGFENSGCEYIYNKTNTNLLAYLNVWKNRETKKEKIRQELKLLKKKQNPYTTNGSKGHLYWLIQISIEIFKFKLQGIRGKQYIGFKAALREFKQAWSNYIVEYRTLLEHLHQNTTGCNMMHYKDGKLYERVSPKSFRVISLRPEPKALKITRKKRFCQADSTMKMLTSLEP